jgi:hypothetical protein
MKETTTTTTGGDEMQTLSPIAITLDLSLVETPAQAEAVINRLDDTNFMEIGGGRISLSTRDGVAGYFGNGATHLTRAILRDIILGWTDECRFVQEPAMWEEWGN